ncbi:hypothetical protein BDZ97DRAFT_2054891 [Flammula alnicola]|nr:hypothetical protein BDZ97DRAFT_2054891 [Flammula alnicola]
MSEDRDPFEDALEQTLDFNMSRLLDLRPDYLEFLDPTCPISFYDRHLDSNLILKHVEYMPCIVQLLSEVCEEEITSLVAGGRPFNPQEGYLPPNNHEIQPFRDSWDVADRYKENAGQFLHSIVSKLYFHPDYQKRGSVFDFNVVRDRTQLFMTSAQLRVRRTHYKPYDLAVGEVLEHIADADADRLRDLAARSPELATWEFYVPTSSGEKVLKTLRNTGNFKWETSRTVGHPKIIPLSRPMDANNGLLEKLLKKRPKMRRTQDKYNTRSNSAGVIPSRPSQYTKNKRPYRVDFAHYLQHAWTRAAVNDATFIVFNCGKFERIGVRHRTSQTLFLSDIINPTSCQNPAYGKLHIGLHAAIIMDALERQKRFQSTERIAHDPIVGNKRSSEDLENSEDTRSKRPKLDDSISVPEPLTDTKASQNNVEDLNTVRAALSTRNLALMNLRYGAYRSPVPSSFIRLGPSCAAGFNDMPFEAPNRKMTYSSAQYFSLTLSEPMGWGAIGVIHRGSADIRLEPGRKLSHSLTVKFVFSMDEEARNKLRHEYSIYQHLASAGGVEGILCVYGLFEDIESGALALIMDEGGTTLTRREVARTGSSEVVHTSETERKALARALKSIHRAGVRHKDIRSDNILVNADNEVFIIDFDQAELGASPDALSRELLCMKHIVDAKGDTDSYYST